MRVCSTFVNFRCATLTSRFHPPCVAVRLTNRKAAAFVSYGSAMGARSVQQLRETAIEIQMAPVRSSVHIPVTTLWAHFQGGDVDKGFAELETQAQTMIDDLLWWTTARQA
jgi:NAD(P)H-dependent FMN reductase